MVRKLLTLHLLAIVVVVLAGCASPGLRPAGDGDPAAACLQWLRQLDDQIDISTHITELGAASIMFEQSAQRDGELLASGQIKVCVVHAQTFKPTRLPFSLRTLLEEARN